MAINVLDPKWLQQFVARDELRDIIDTLYIKIEQCKLSGMDNKEIQLIIDCYHGQHVSYPIIKV
jgi:hypothetical protein